MKLFMYEIIYLGVFLQVNLVARRRWKRLKMSVSSEYQIVFQKGYINLFHSAIYKVTCSITSGCALAPGLAWSRPSLYSILFCLFNMPVNAMAMKKSKESPIFLLSC